MNAYKEKKYMVWMLVLAFTFGFQSCKKESQSTVKPTPPPNNSGETDPPEIDRVDDFIWEAMNSWYYFSGNVPNLADSKDDDATKYANFLNGFSTPEELFKTLLDKQSETFSYMSKDYKELGGGLQAVHHSYGYEYSLLLYGGKDSNSILGYVRFVYPNSPAEKAGLKRGDIFLKVNGISLNVENYRSLLFNGEDYELSMAEIKEKTIYPLNKKVKVNKNTDIKRTPIWKTNVVDLNGQKVGYLSFAQFAYNFHSEMNAVFSDFKSQGVTDLVLDLRYNPGGSVLTAQYLASMIHTTDTNKELSELRYNSKHRNLNNKMYFQQTMKIKDKEFNTTGTERINSLNLNRLFVITSSNTASASEFIINSLRPYIPVTIIGDKTVGKNLGSITLVDSPSSDYTNKDNVNPTHKYGLQPIVSRVYNSKGESNYSNGFDADIQIRETQYLETMYPLGDEREVLFAKALEQICPSCRTQPIEPTTANMNFEEIAESSEVYNDYQILNIDGVFE